MKQSQLFSKTTKNVSKEETSINAQLLLRGGYVNREMAGAYAYLPLGWRVLQNVIGIIREEMNAVGGQEVLMTALQEQALWEQTDRWSDEASDVWFRTQLKSGSDLGLGWTHEEPMTRLAMQHLRSYRDFPAMLYQFQTKFRNETRAKSGILRCREFIMKDLYSFSRTQEEHDELYEQIKQAYIRIYQRVGLGDVTYLTFASGGAFSKYSHEFQTLTDAGEDIIYIDATKNIAINKEVFNDEVLAQLEVDKNSVEERKAIEVGNIFTLGTRFSEPLGLTYVDEHGKNQPVIMGSYGIGPGRVMGAVVEVSHDDKGIIWPEALAPYKLHLINLNNSSDQADALYAALQQTGFEVLYDDRKESAGAKFADADLLGISHRLVVSERNGDKVEYSKRVVGGTDESKLFTEAELMQFLQA